MSGHMRLGLFEHPFGCAFAFKELHSCRSSMLCHCWWSAAFCRSALPLCDCLGLGNVERSAWLPGCTCLQRHGIADFLTIRGGTKHISMHNACT